MYTLQRGRVKRSGQRGCVAVRMPGGFCPRAAKPPCAGPRAAEPAAAGTLPVAHSGVTTTSRTSPRDGRSNITSLMILSMTARSPRAPVPRRNVRPAISLSAPGSKVSPTPSSSNIFWYCFGPARSGAPAGCEGGSLFVEFIELDTVTGSRPDKLGDEAEALEILGLQPGPSGPRPRHRSRRRPAESASPLWPVHVVTEPDLPPARGACSTILSRPSKAPPQMKRMLVRVDLDVLLLGVLAAALGRHVGHRPLQDLEECLLHPLARHVPRDRGVLRLAGDLVELVDVDDPPLAIVQC